MTTNTKEKATPTAAIPNTTNLKDTSIAAQCNRLKAALKGQPMNTYEIRTDLDIMEVAARVWDLRNKYGCDIHTQMIWVESELGVSHKIAQYSLISETLEVAHA